MVVVTASAATTPRHTELYQIAAKRLTLIDLNQQETFGVFHIDGWLGLINRQLGFN